MAGMRKTKKRRAGSRPLSDQLRATILTCGESRYAISKATGITEQALSKFVCGHQKGLSWDSVDILGKYLGLRIVVNAKLKKGK